MKKILLIVGILALFSADFTVAQTPFHFTVGTPNGSNGGNIYPSPFTNWYWGTRQQYLILASELNALGVTKGDITEVSFNVTAINACPALTNYQMWVKTTSNSPSLTAWEPNMGSPVYGPATYSPQVGLNTFTFPKIAWNGTDNIVIEICSNLSSYISNGNASVQWSTGMSFNASKTYRADNSTNCGTNLNQTLSPTNRPIITLRIDPPYQNDSEPVSFDLPGQAICNSGKSVQVSISNKGISNLYSTKIGWTVIRNGNSFPINSFIWNGNLGPETSANNIPVGQFATGFENGDLFKFWTSEPNGFIDSNIVNDTIILDMREGVSGKFNVGGFFNLDFANMQTATQFVDSFGAVCDSLIFNVRDGIYSGQIEFKEVLNTGIDRPIIFRAEKGEQGNVILLDSNISSSSNFIAKFDQVKHIIFENITFMNLSNNFDQVIQIVNGASNITFTNCTFKNSYNGTSTSTNHYLVYSGNKQLNNNLTFNDCDFINGNVALSAKGIAQDTALSNISILNCNFINQSVNAVQIENCKNLAINSNTFTSVNAFLNNSSSISLLNISGSLEISKNSISSVNGFPSAGINISNYVGSPLNPGIVTNNFVSVGLKNSPNNYSGMNIEEGNFTNILNNSILVSGINVSSSGMSIIGGGANNFINNNIFNEATGFALFIEETVGFPVFKSDYNNLYSNGSFVVKHKLRTYTSLSSWANAQGDDLNSISVNPNFISNSDLHVCGAVLNNKGLGLSMVKTDADGDSRNVNTPDIGADEFSPISNLDLGPDTSLCKGSEISLNGSLNFNDLSNTWSTGDSSAVISVSQPGTYSVTSSNVCGTSSDTIVVTLSTPANLGSDQNICADDSTILSSPNPGSTFMWNNRATDESLIVKEAGIYSIVVTDPDGCVTTDTVFVTQSLKVELPLDTSYCGGSALILDPGTGQGTYLWSTGSTNNVILTSNSGNYSVTYTDMLNCTSSDDVTVLSTTIPSASFSTNQVKQTAQFFGATYLNAKYFWSFGDGDTATIQNPTHVFNHGGTYLTTLQITNDCGFNLSSKSLVIDDVVGVGEINSAATYEIYPNPTSGAVTIKIPNEEVHITIFSTDGKLVFSKKISNGNGLYQNDFNNLSKGSYSIKLKTSTSVYTENLIIQ